ncbi:MAG: hypothetical protein ACLS2V_12980 [Clostridium paraputrificum]|uniref:hypothetical protein n=1 Tax=Clostridium sp. TaxID=1506 RepID=UPI0025BA40E9|nr:hypothetical protein [Clostridium sp.]MBS5926217.1 hypothetical protein [Clostridium sp.]
MRNKEITQGKKLIALFIIMVILVGVIGTGRYIFSKYNEKKDNTKIEVLECDIIENMEVKKTDLFACLGITSDKEYTTVIKVNEETITLKDEDIYYACKDKKKNKFEIKMYKGKVKKVLKIA